MHDIFMYMDSTYCRSTSDVLTVREFGVLTGPGTQVPRAFYKPVTMSNSMHLKNVCTILPYRKV